MKRLIILLLLFSFYEIHSQTIGAGIGYTNTESYYYDASLTFGKNIFILGYTEQPTEAKGKLVDERLPNYSNKLDGIGEYFSSYDVGFCYRFFEKFYFGGELSFAKRNKYAQYLDLRFSGDHYYIVTNSQADVGFGIIAGAIIIDRLHLVVKYNTIRDYSFGVNFQFVKY